MAFIATVASYGTAILIAGFALWLVVDLFRKK
jgi:hypothetical protein